MLLFTCFKKKEAQPRTSSWRKKGKTEVRVAVTINGVLSSKVGQAQCQSARREESLISPAVLSGSLFTSEWWKLRIIFKIFSVSLG